MITRENHIHNQYLIKRAALQVFDMLKQEYDFVEFKDFSKYNLSDSTFLGIKKNEVILYCFISTREAYELCILENGKEEYESDSVDSLFMEKFPPLSLESKSELERKKMELGNLIQHSFEYYYENMLWDINFLKKYYPEIIEDGLIKT